MEQVGGRVMGRFVATAGGVHLGPPCHGGEEGLCIPRNKGHTVHKAPIRFLHVRHSKHGGAVGQGAKVGLFTPTFSIKGASV